MLNNILKPQLSKSFRIIQPIFFNLSAISSKTNYPQNEQISKNNLGSFCRIKKPNIENNNYFGINLYNNNWNKLLKGQREENNIFRTLNCFSNSGIGVRHFGIQFTKPKKKYKLKSHSGFKKRFRMVNLFHFDLLVRIF